MIGKYYELLGDSNYSSEKNHMTGTNSVGVNESFDKIHSYKSSVMSDSNLESNLQRLMNL